MRLKKQQITGIYKIQSPTGKVYIGQSWEIEKRWISHKGHFGRSKLINSLKKYGNETHIFKIIHVLPPDVSQQVLNDYEQLYMDAYRSVGIELLNLREAGSWGRHCEETRKIISEKGKGRKQSDEMKRKTSERFKGHKFNTGRKFSDEQRKKMSEAGKNRIMTIEHRKNISISKKGDKSYLHGIEPSIHPRAKKIICINTGARYGTVNEAAKAIGIHRSTLSMQLVGKHKNTSGLTYDA